MTQSKNEQNGTSASLGGTPSKTSATNDISVSKPTSEPSKSPERLREDIARTRSALSQDMAALGEKLNPEQLKENAKEIARDAKDAAFDSLRHAKDHALESISEGVHEIGGRARAVGHDVSDFVATHAVPLTLAGLGVGWLLVSISHQRRVQQRYLSPSYSATGYDYGEDSLSSRARQRANAIGSRAGALTNRAAEALHEGKERLVDGAHAIESRVAERAGQLRSQVVHGAEQLGEQASELGHRAYDGIGRAGTRAVEVSEHNPLATGLFILAAGVAAGFLLPSTRRENEWLGGTRDRLIEDAQRKASELKQSVQQGAEDVRGAIAELQHPSH